MEVNSKITLYLDADDTVLRSSEAMIEILNKKYNINPAKTIKDLSDWGYRSIYGHMTPEEVREIYASDEFFDIVKINSTFLDFFKKSLAKVNFVFVTKGTPENIEKKEKYLRENLGLDFEYIGIPFKLDADGKVNTSFSKRSINMKHGIQIDDRVDCLKDSNAPIKILIKTYGDHYWNQMKDYSGIPNLYVVDNWEQAIQIIEFAYNEHFIFKKCN